MHLKSYHELVSMKNAYIALGKTIAGIILLFCSSSVSAHSPHDIIFDVALSPNYESDRTVLIIVSNTLMESTDEGYTWKKLANGLDNASQLTSISISPDFRQDGIVLVTSEGDGIYRSQNGGKSWEKSNQGLQNLNIRSVRISPRFCENKSVIALDETGRVYQSRDSALTWRPINFEFSGKVTCINYLCAGTNERLLAGTNDGYVLISDENINRWEKIPIQSGCIAIDSIAVSPLFKEDNTIWVGSQNCGVFELDTKEKSFSAVNQGLTDRNITSIISTLGSEEDIILYASTWDQGLFQLNGKQRVWKKYDKGLSTDPQAKDPYFLMPNFKGIAAQKEILYLGGFDGLFKSTNGGRNWEQLDTIMLSGITGLAVYAEKNMQKHEVALATYGAGAYLYDSKDANWSIINKGLAWTRLNDISFSTNYLIDGTILSGSENNFLLFDNQEKIWQRVPVQESKKRHVLKRVNYYLKKLGVGLKWRNKILEPISGDALFPTSIGPSPDFENDKTLYFGTRSSGLYISLDAGASNYQLWEAEGKTVTSICLSPEFAKDGIMYTGIEDGGIFESQNKGKTWRKIDVKIPNNGPVHLEISPNFKNDRTLLAGNSSGLYASMNGGMEWKRIGTQELGDAPNVVCVAISPSFKEDNMMLAGISGKGLWVTRDSGETFKPFAKELIENNYQAKFIKFSPNYHEDGVIYCASSYELFRSLDEGLSWQMVNRPIRYENFREEIKFNGVWKIETDDRYSAMNASFTVNADSSFRLRFKGYGFTWIGDKSPRNGQAKIYIDDVLLKTISQTSKREQKGVEVFSMQGLEEKSHELTVEMFCAEKDPECKAVSIDAIDVFSH